MHYVWVKCPVHLHKHTSTHTDCVCLCVCVSEQGISSVDGTIDSLGHPSILRHCFSTSTRFAIRNLNKREIVSIFVPREYRAYSLILFISWYKALSSRNGGPTMLSPCHPYDSEVNILRFSTLKNLSHYTSWETKLGTNSFGIWKLLLEGLKEHLHRNIMGCLVFNLKTQFFHTHSSSKNYSKDSMIISTRPVFLILTKTPLNFKTEPGFEKYLEMKNVWVRQQVTMFRLSLHCLTIETGRYIGLHEEEFCPDKDEDKVHFRFECTLIKHLNATFFLNPYKSNQRFWILPTGVENESTVVWNGIWYLQIYFRWFWTEIFFMSTPKSIGWFF